MQKILLCLIWLLAFACSPAVASEGRATAPEAVAMVQKVVAFMRANGKEKTIAEVNNINGPFRDRDLYVTINDLTAKTLAHGANVKMQGKKFDRSERRRRQILHARAPRTGEERWQGMAGI